MSDGHVDGRNLICGVHGWDYRLDSGVSAYNNGEALHRFASWVDDGCAGGKFQLHEYACGDGAGSPTAVWCHENPHGQ